MIVENLFFCTKPNSSDYLSTTNETYNYYFIKPDKDEPFKLPDVLSSDLGDYVDILGVENNCKIDNEVIKINNIYSYFNQLTKYDVVVFKN